MYIPSTGGLLEIPVVVDSFPGQIGGFRLCLAERGYDFTVLKVEPGELMTACGWEYLNWRRVAVTAETGYPWDVHPSTATSLLEITGFASVSEGYQASCYASGSRMELVRIHTAFASPSWAGNVNTACSSRPLMFYWRDCNDNVLYSRSGDTLFAASELLWPHVGISPSDSLNVVFPGYGSPDQTCLAGPEVAVPAFTAVDGYYDIICTDSVNPWIGDINCDGYAYTIADAIRYTRYFVWGLGVLTCTEQAISGSDINGDGLTLTVADLVQLIKITTGEGFYLDPIWHSFEFAKPVATFNKATLRISETSSDSRCLISSDQPIAACYVRLVSANDRPLRESDLRELAPEAMVGTIGDTLTLLWIDQSGEPVFGPGSYPLFASNDSRFRIVHSEVVGMNAKPMSVEVSQTVPAEFRLEQNVPNPFNPTTVISYTLNSPGRVTLEVYNVYGRQVIKLVDAYQSAGIHDVTWHAVDQSGEPIASGLYFYRLSTGTDVATRKMLLLK
ncbi:MAG: T9SS type A sorting domain-containing protein [bacterium]|nr:T9SS type A sorting domain-containing protein [bacterium]